MSAFDKSIRNKWQEIQKVAENWKISIEILSSEQAGHIKNSIYQKLYKILSETCENREFYLKSYEK